MAEEERHDQRSDMRTIDIGIGHDDHLVITNLRKVECFRVLFGTEGDTERREDITHLFRLEHLMLHRFLHIQDLTAQRQDSLMHTVTTGLGRTACRISLHEEQLAFFRILAHTIGQLTGQATATQRRLAQHALTGITRRDTSLRSQNHFLYYLLRVVRMLLQVVLQRLSYGTGYHTGHFRVTEFGLRLTLELRLSHLDGDNSRQTFTEIVRIDSRVAVFVFQLGLLQHLALLRIFLHHARQRGTETGHMRTSLDGIDIVDIRVHILIEIGVVDHRHLYRRAVLVSIEMDHLRDQRCTRTVDITHELAQTLLRVELLFLAVTLRIDHTLVLEHDLDTGVQESQLAHTVRQNLPMVNGLREDRIVRPELHECTRLALLPVTRCLLLCNRMNRSQRLALLVILTMNSACTINLHMHLLRQCIHAAHTHTVQTAGYLIAVLVELTAGVQHGHHHLQRRLMLLRMHIHRYTTAVILYGNRVVLIDMNGYLVAETGQRLVYRVIDHLIHQMMQTFLRNIADVHRRTLTHCL